MFIGHFGVGLAAKAVAPRAPLGWLVAAPLLLDLVWPIFLLLGWESVRIEPGATIVTPLDFEHYPMSHSLIAAIGWGSLVSVLFLLRYRLGREAIIVELLVVSHWLLDWVVHRPDLPLYPGGTKFGLGLWNSVPATLALEALFFGSGVWLYARSTQATANGGRLGWWAFVAFLVLVYAMNFLGPPPETIEQVAWVTLALWIMPFWAWGFDRNRRSTAFG